MKDRRPDFLKRRPTLGVGSIFQQAVNRPESHTRLRRELLRIYPTDKKGYTMEVMQCLARIFTASDRVPGTDVVLDFSAKVCVSHEQEFGDEDPFIEDIFGFIFDYHDRKNPNIRVRSCQFISKILNEMGDQAVLDQSIFEKIGNTMLERLQDKCPNIRAEAILALHRLQDPYDTECTIVKTFIFHMEFDPSPIVREKVVKHIAVASQTLPHIVNRIKDSHENVKKAAFKTLSKLKVIRFTIAQRQSILTYGINCKQEEIKTFAIEQLLLVWFKQYDCNMLKLYDVLFVENFDEETLKIITFELFKKQATSSLIELMKVYLNVDKVVFMDKFTPEVVTFWHYLVVYLSSSEMQGESYDEDIVFEILPTLSRFTNFISEVSKVYTSDLVQNRYMMRVVLDIASTYSLSDESGRNNLKALCIQMLCKESELSYVPKLSKLILNIISNPKERCALLCEIIQDIRDPPDEETQIGKVMSDPEGNLRDAAMDLKNDPETLVKCLSITHEFLLAPDVKELYPSLLSLKDYFIMPCLKERNSRILNLVHKILTQMCIRNLEISQQVFFHFCLQVNDPSTCLTAVNGIFDILVAHGMNLYNVEEEEQENKPEPKQGNLTIDDLPHDPTLEKSVKLVTLLMSLLDSSDIEIKVQVCLGLAKLILAGRINSPLVLAHLTLAWFNPEFADKELVIRSGLGMFFSMLAFKRPKGREVIIGSFVPTLKAIEDAKEPDPITEIDPNAVAKLLVHLLCDRDDSSQSELEPGSFHYRLALIICDELKSGEIDSWVLVRALSHLELQLSDGKNASILLQHLEKCLKSNKLKKDKKTYKMLENFHLNVIELQKSYEKDPESEARIDEPTTSKAASKVTKKAGKQTKGKSAKKLFDTPEEPQIADRSLSPDINAMEKLRVSSPLMMENSDDEDIENKNPANQDMDAESSPEETPPKKQKIKDTFESSEEETEDSIVQAKPPKNRKKHKIVSNSSSNEDENLTPSKQGKIDKNLEDSNISVVEESSDESEDSFVPPSIKKNPRKNAFKVESRPSIKFRTRAQKKNKK